MRLFSRNKDAVETARGADVAFESLKRSPRNVRKTRSDDADKSAPLDPAEAAKTRARRRLIGAIALALAAIVFVPMLFDRTPVAPNDDIALQIPDRDSPFEGRRGVPDPSRGPLRPAPEPTTAPDAAAGSATPVVSEPPSESTAVAPVVKSADVTPPVVAKAAPPAPAKSVENQAEKATEKHTAEKQAAEKQAAEKQAAEKQAAEKQAEKPALAGDDPRALAALEGRSASPAPDVAGDRSYAVQVAAFSAADKAKGLRDQLVGNGLKSYTESVSTAQGLRTRVRLGPFTSREAADRARQKLKTMKLDGSVVPL